MKHRDRHSKAWFVWREAKAAAKRMRAVGLPATTADMLPRPVEVKLGYYGQVQQKPPKPTEEQWKQFLNAVAPVDVVQATAYKPHPWPLIK